MKKYRHNFTLTEVLTVIAIIGILAAITTPVVIMSRDRGRVAQAQGDISAIITALKQMHTDYGKVVGAVGKNGVVIINGADYDAMIAELSVPKNKKFESQRPSVNKRRKIYLDPKKEFDPSEKYDEVNNLAALYRDPWGEPYVVYINASYGEQLELPGTRQKLSKNDDKKTVTGNFAAYSFGANGVDDKGCNADYYEPEQCIKKGASEEDHRNHDDIASWTF